MKHFFSALLMVLFATSMMAQTGLTCYDPIPVNQDYKGTVDGPCELWYTANTYDLPIHVYFSPNSDNSEWGPEVEIDFTCTPGVYDDKKLDSLVNLVGNFDITFPVVLPSDLVVRNGRNEFDLVISKSYRDQLSDFGITYALQALVKVTYYEGGSISLSPDTAFASCMNTADSVALGDTLEILANDLERVFVFPYTIWQEDSIRFVWTGEGAAQVYVAVQECEFMPGDPYVFDNFAITQDAPHKLYSEDMKEIMKEQKEGGVYYAKVVAPSAGKFVVEKIPMAAAQGGAIVLEHGAEYVLEDVLYCFPKTWTATEIVAATDKQVEMYVSNIPDFVASSDDSNVLYIRSFDLDESNRVTHLSGAELAGLIAQATDDYLYVRFSCPQLTKIVINSWSTSECTDESFLIQPNVPQYIEAKSSHMVYRLRYEDFAGYNLTVNWESINRLPIYIARKCDFSPSTNNSALLLRPAPSIAAGGSLEVEASRVDAWASRIDDNGYFYVRFNPNNAGTVTFITEKTAVLDPIFTTITDTLCFGKEYDWDGTIYTESGTYEKTFTALNGADSIVTINLTILPEVLPTTDEVTVRYDELPYLWNDSAFVESTEYTATLQDAYGCDSVVTLKLTVLEKSDIKTTDDVMLNLASAFKVYTMDHTDWVADDVKVNWEGASPLHVFVAKEEIYNLTPFNRYVLHYEVVPAGEEWVVTKEQMAAWEAEATAAGGKLYVRFLTEKDGRLTTVPMD